MTNLQDLSNIIPIPGFASYFADTHGNIYSTKRGEIKKLTPQSDRFGYNYFFLRTNNTRKFKLVHRLIALTFIGESKLTINHKNGIKNDNRIENLEYCTQSENNFHAVKSGFKPSLKGVMHPQAKLTEMDVLAIRLWLDNKLSTGVSLAKRFGVKPGIISRIKLKQSWSHLF